MKLFIVVMTLTFAVCGEAIAQDKTQDGDRNKAFEFSCVLQSKRSTVMTNLIPGRNSIASILPEWTAVKAGDVLCTIEVSDLQARAEALKVEVAHARADFDRTVSEHETQMRSEIIEQRASVISVAAAKMAKEAWVQGEFPIRKAELEGEIQIGTAELEFAKHSASERNQASLERLHAEVEAARANVKVRVAQLQLKHLQEFLNPQRLADLEAEIELATMKMELASMGGQEVSNVSDRAAKKNQVTLLEEQLKQAVEHVGSAEIIAPHDGVVTFTFPEAGRARTIVTKVGQVVRERQPLMQVQDPSEMQAVVRLESNVPQLFKVGAEVDIQVDALPNKHYTGKITRIDDAPSRDGKVTGFISIETGGHKELLRSGMTAQATIGRGE